MAVYEVETDQGVFEVEVEDSATSSPVSAPNQPTQQQPGMLKKGWDLLAKPEQLSRQGLGMMAKAVPSFEPTGNMFRDVAVNTPKIMAETVAEAAPGFVSRGSILTAGGLKGYQAAKPLLKPLGKAAATGLEAFSGLEHKTPGVLTEAFKSPKILFGKGLDTARKAYKTAEEAADVREAFKAPLDKKDLVMQALDAAKQGTLTPAEALEARKSLDAIKKGLSGIGYAETRKIFDGIAKKMFASADEAFKTGIKSEAVRSIFPMNKTGGASAFKTGIGAMVPPLAPLMSPVVQGTAATGLGLADRLATALAQSPIKSGSTVGELLNYLRSQGSVDNVR